MGKAAGNVGFLILGLSLESKLCAPLSVPYEHEGRISPSFIGQTLIPGTVSPPSSKFSNSRWIYMRDRFEARYGHRVARRPLMGVGPGTHRR
ncbi:hypothetical protein SAMD00023353_6200050 [Rosellinia necatrix]|uniref:Secreted protein n=1 Tax=Rosellinia necatrix TaxID=77044 RepID=A0A1S8AA72_ROSNE|nr:hypothetical protein SAMD00023353_6200050 [Rosellinia necatrix]